MRKLLISALAVAAFVAATVSCSDSFTLADHIGMCGEKNGVAAKDCGMDYVEVSVSRFLAPEKDEERFLENLAFAADSLPPLYAANGFFPKDIKLTGPEADLPRAIAYGKTAIQRASKAGIEILVLGSGAARTIPEEFPCEEAQNQFVSLLDSLAEEASAYGIVIAIEPLQSKETNFINTVSEGAAIARLTGRENVAVIADFYHMAAEGEGPESIIANADKLVHCHVAEPEKRTAPGVQGTDFTPYFKALRQIGYKGRISIECRWSDIRSELPVALETLKDQIKASK